MKLDEEIEFRNNTKTVSKSNALQLWAKERDATEENRHSITYNEHGTKQSG